ncbi:hypothetical protein PMIN04_001101 [Paraphaeosphaeria minitans]
MTDNIRTPKVQSSSVPLSAPLWQLEQGMSTTKKHIKEASLDHSSKSSIDLPAALARGEMGEMGPLRSKQKLAAEQNEMAETLDEILQSNGKYQKQKEEAKERLKKHEEKHVAHLEEAVKKTRAKGWQESKEHFMSNADRAITYELEKKGAKLELKMKQEYKQKLKHHLQEKDEKTKQKLEKHKEAMEAEWEEKLDALKQEREKKQREHVAPDTHNLLSPPSSQDMQIEKAASGCVNDPVSPLQSMQPSASKSPVASCEKRDPKPLSGTTLSEHNHGSKTPADIEEPTGADATFLKRNTAWRTTRTQQSTTQSQTAALSEEKPSISPEAPELDPDLDVTNTPQPERDAPTGTSDNVSDVVSKLASSVKRKRSVVDDEDGHNDELSTVLPKKPRTKTLSASSDSKVIKFGGPYHMQWNGLPQWKTIRAEMTPEETHEFEPLYNPPDSPITYGGLTRWPIVKGDEEDEELQVHDHVLTSS